MGEQSEGERGYRRAKQSRWAEVRDKAVHTGHNSICPGSWGARHRADICGSSLGTGLGEVLGRGLGSPLEAFGVSPVRDGAAQLSWRRRANSGEAGEEVGCRGPGCEGRGGIGPTQHSDEAAAMASPFQSLEGGVG